jgi:hypothetical protein
MGGRGRRPWSLFLQIASRALQSVGRGRSASALPAGDQSPLGSDDFCGAKSHIVEPSGPAQLDTAACHFEMLERLELGVGGWQPAARSARR